MKTDTNTYILTIAGLDPSNGAGLVADVKTFHAHGLYGLSVCTAVTVQNDISFKNSHWIATAVILDQIEVLFTRFEIAVVKIGIVQNWDVLDAITKKLKQLDSSIKIILDPVLSASAGYDFHTKEDDTLFAAILDKIYFITPNYEEVKQLLPDKSIEDTIAYLSSKTNVYLKGGHRDDHKGRDEVYHSGIVQINLEPGVESVFEKHGSGCVLASALASNIALGYPLEDASSNAKRYTEEFLNSNETLLGSHSSVLKTNTASNLNIH